MSSVSLMAHSASLPAESAATACFLVSLSAAKCPYVWAQMVTVGGAEADTKQRHERSSAVLQTRAGQYGEPVCGCPGKRQQCRSRESLREGSMRVEEAQW